MFDTAVLIGRFQPVHSGHLALLHAALAQARQVVVVVGSAFQARTPKNPFTWPERAALLRACLPEDVQARLHILPGNIASVPEAEPLSSADADEVERILADENLRTDAPGIFAAGDCRAKLFRQVVTAAGDGANAVHSAELYLDEVKGQVY